MNAAQNGFAKIGFHVVRCCSDYINMIGFQLGLHKNQIWADSLNKAIVMCLPECSVFAKLNRSIF